MAVFTKGVVPWNSLDDNTRLPLTSELEGGYPCGQADQQLFNFTAGYSWGQVHNVIVSTGAAVDLTDLTQLTDSIQFMIDGSIPPPIPRPPHPTKTVYSTPGVYSVSIPNDVTGVFVRLWGGGGGGGGGANTVIAWAGEGGGGGAYNEGWVSFTPGGSISIEVGAGGAGGPAISPGANGGQSSCGGLIAGGGNGGGYSSASTTDENPGGSGNSSAAISGGAGSIVTFNGSLTAAAGGSGGSSPNGGQGGGVSSALASSGIAPGGGGGGAGGPGGFFGGNGANGRVEVIFRY